jgi:hypothetical protein
MPERVLFRVNFGFVGAFLSLLSIPMYTMLSQRVPSSLTNVAAVFQVLSGFGVVLVGACGPSENITVHLIGAFLGFGGSAIAQILYNFVLYQEDTKTQTESSKKFFVRRCILSVSFLVTAVVCGLGNAGVLPDPTKHVAEWGLWFILLGWYFTMRWDLKDFCVASVEDEAAYIGVPLLL